MPMTDHTLQPVDFDPFAAGPLLKTAPATESQLEIWTSVQFGSDANCAFNESIALTLSGQLDEQALDRAIEKLISRHEGLRTTFSPNGKTLIISSEPHVEKNVHDLSPLGDTEQTQQLALLEEETARKPFDLENGPLIRMALIKLKQDRHVLLITSHHIVCDGWSIWVILEELGTLYTAACNNTFAELETPSQFSEYAMLLNERMHGESWKQDEEFWLKTFTPVPTPLDIPTTHKRPANRTFASARKNFILPAKLVTSLKSYAIEEKTTLTVVLLSAFSAFLYRLSGNTDPIVGVPASGQAASGHTYLIGHCVNLLPMRCGITPEDSFSSYVRHYKESMLNAFDHQQYTYGSLLQKLNIHRDAGRAPLVPVLFNIDQGLGSVIYGELEVAYYTPPRAFENFEIFLNASEISGELRIECQYNTDLFSDRSMTFRLQEFECFLENLLDTPQNLLTRIPVICREEQEMLTLWNQTGADVPAQCIHELVEEQAHLHPEKKAILFAGESINYRTLNQKADQLAIRLQREGIRSGALAGLYLSRSIDMVISMLAVLKAGGAYVPLDPNYPARRIHSMIENSGMALILTNSQLKPGLPAQTQQLLVDELSTHVQPDEHPIHKVTPDDLAYVIYTSGSTGQPKGVQIHHRAVVNFLASMAQSPGLQEDDTLLAVKTLSFDIAVLEIFLPLSKGATVALASIEEATDGHLLQKLIKKNSATVMQATPATWQMLLTADWPGLPEKLKILCGGEALPTSLAKELLPRCKELWNMYGPTETTIWSTCFRVTSAIDTIPIGKPINNTSIYLLDKNQQQVPIGVPAELHIGGAGLSRGYLNRDELTAKQFIPNPLPDRQNEILYKTGDLVRLCEDGNLLYSNRLDNQIKVRGFRIELEEIETALVKHPDVKQAAVVSKETEGNIQLVAYCIFSGKTPPDSSLLKKYLRQLLPHYMIPQFFVRLEHLPLTPAGKIDRKNLVAREVEHISDKRETLPPKTPTERALHHIWCRVLKLGKISVLENFFDAGGHSLLAVELFSDIKKEYSLELPLALLFQAPTIRELSEHIDSELYRIETPDKPTDTRSDQEREEFEF